ncbi:MAG TPA: TonB family protein [bacterium]|nr:TonB family protein [bacterium]
MRRACDAIRPLLGAFADKELDPDRTRQVQQHLETCADCRRELDQIEGLGRIVRGVQRPRLVDDYWDWQRDRVWRGILSEGRRPLLNRRPMQAWTRLLMPVISAAVLLIAVVAGWHLLSEKSFMTGRGMVVERIVSQGRESPSVAAHEERGQVAAAKPVGTGAAASEGQVELAATRPGAAKAEAGYGGKGLGAAGTPSRAKLSLAENRASPARSAAAGERSDELASLPPATAQPVAAASGARGRIVSGPVLLETPPLADKDALDTGTVLLGVKTDTGGRVLSVAVHRSSGSAKVDSVAVRQMRRSRFQATVRNNRSVSASFEYPFRVQKTQTRQSVQPATPSQPTKLNHTDKSVKQGDQPAVKSQDTVNKQDDSPDSGQQQGKPTRASR